MVFFWESHIRAQRSCQMPSVHDHLAPGFDKRGMAEPMTEERLAVLLVAVLCPAHAADHLLGRDPVHPLGIDAHEVLAAAGHNVGLESVVTEILHHFEHVVAETITQSYMERLLSRGCVCVHFVSKKCGFQSVHMLMIV